MSDPAMEMFRAKARPVASYLVKLKDIENRLRKVEKDIKELRRDRVSK
jgi:hypothetical protein